MDFPGDVHMNIPVHTLDVTLGGLKLEGKTFYEVMVAGVKGTSKVTTNNRMKCSEKLYEWTAIRWTGRGQVVDTLQNCWQTARRGILFK